MRKIISDRPHMNSKTVEYREVLAKYDPEFLEQYHLNYMKVMSRKRALPERFKAILMLAYCATLRYEPGFRTYMVQALKAGASKEEILESLEIISLAGGGPVLSFSLPLFHEIVREYP
jgi:alkylhydroperoxidase/carboxymuconolactone decarboxylase family protein YurZ